MANPPTQTQAKSPDPWLERLAEEDRPEMQPIPPSEALLDLLKFIDEIHRRIYEALGIRNL